MAKYVQLASGVLVEASTVGASAGIADAGKVVHLDAAGKLDASLMPLSAAAPARVLLAADLAPNSAIALADATGLSFAVLANTYYRFKFWVVFQSAATTTGIQLSVNAPASSVLAYNCTIPISATTAVLGFRRAANVASIGTGVDVVASNLLAIVEGIVRPTAGGVLMLRYSSEIAASAVTIKAGSCGELITLG